jgi:outer membrane protein assembly factor BamB
MSYVGVLDEEVGIHPNPGLPLIIGDTIFVSSNGFAGAYTVALDAQSGQELWMTKTGDFSAEMPALFGEALLVGSDNGDLLALDPATGTERWRIPVSNRIEVALDQSSPPLTANGLIFVRNEIGSVVALGLAA